MDLAAAPDVDRVGTPDMALARYIART